MAIIHTNVPADAPADAVAYLHPSASQDRNILTLPNEILYMILTRVMTSTEPVNFPELVELNHGTQRRRSNSDLEKEVKEAKKRHAAIRERITTDPHYHKYGRRDGPPTSSADTCLPGLADHSRGSHSQFLHFRDWCLVNRTCRALRAIGRRLFFVKKTFLITPSFLNALETGRVRNMTASDIALARECIHEIFIPLRSTGAAAPYIKLPRYNYFTNLRKLSIQPLPAFEYYFSNKRTIALPQELSDLLRGIGVPVDKWNMELVCDSNKNAKRDMLGSLIHDVYPLLQVLVNARAARAEAMRQAT